MNESPWVVVFTYSFTDEASAFMFFSEQEAIDYLVGCYHEEMRVCIEENEWQTEGFILEDGRYAKITTIFSDGEDVTEIHLASVEI